jgi:hypothetical protein
MKERPILFKGEMVRAILDGRKTQTRRMVYPQPQETLQARPYWHVGGFRTARGCTNPLRFKYGKAGDRLWVKETWKPHCEGEISPEFPLGTCVKYRADGKCIKPESWTNEQGRWCESQEESKVWKPSIFMPRWASRITLEIVNVRVERLQAINDFDAFQEGAKSECGTVTGPACMSFIQGYKTLWESINGADSWAKNPWVWVIEFKKL